MNAHVPVRDVTDSDLSLDELAHEIVVRAQKADDHLIAAAMRFRELRTRIEAGESGEGVHWRVWMKKHIALSPSRLYELMSIADAADPSAKLEEIRRGNRERQKRHREQVKEEATAEDNDLTRDEAHRWIDAASLHDVAAIVVQMRKLHAADAGGGDE